VLEFNPTVNRALRTPSGEADIKNQRSGKFTIASAQATAGGKWF
jgi:hypothetical protein